MSKNKIEISVKDIPEIIKTLEEAEKEIEFERKSKNLFIDDLYKVCEISLQQDKEIEILHSIIKEVREYIEEHTENVELNIYGMPPVIRSFRGNTQTLLEILDKAGDIK